ncbi:hypothetical protein SteCoe_9556 [Stentor coeruleus]|uniref:UBA domain-containing protein n=1 Tax=Stentor coeruleus TaxID=5963 RepID=A0A1R2CHT4_9CILI|nr:hypothetical protein SteCoe_9556 [Stentor coeruleus]
METQGQSISSMVDQSLVTQLIEMGFSKNVSEKSIFLTQAKSVEPAMDWISEHQGDPDFEEELQIIQGLTPSSMTSEEAQARARDLQLKLKQDREKKDKELELQREKDRIRTNKELSEAKAKFEEQERKRAIDEQMRQKKKVQNELKDQQEILRREKEERFGKKFSVNEEEKPPEERINGALKAIKTLHPNYRNPGVAKTCMITLRAYTSNILKNPEEAKFRSIKADNKAFQDRVAKVTGGINYLKAVRIELLRSQEG